MEDVVLSVIVTAHDEGELVGLSLDSLRVAVGELAGVKVDFWINIDRGDKKTRTFLNKYKKEYGEKYKINIQETDFGDPGLARNAIVGVAKGKYIVMIDADDMVSRNWVKVALKMVMEDGAILVHPEVEFRYNKKGGESIITRTSGEDLWRSTLMMLGGNRWCSVVMGKREVFLTHQYSANGDGIGYEDYYFNCETIGGKIRHLLAKDTSCFLLQKESSVTSRTHENYDVLARTKIFDLNYLQKMIKRKGLPEIASKVETAEIPEFFKEQAQGAGLADAVKSLPDNAVFKNSEDIDLAFGIVFGKMLERARLKKRYKTLVFVGNLVEYVEAGKNYGRDVLVVSSNRIDNLMTRNNYINLGGALDEARNNVLYGMFGGVFDIWMDTAMTLVIMQSGVEEIVINDNDKVRGWVNSHQGLKQIRVAKLT